MSNIDTLVDELKKKSYKPITMCKKLVNLFKEFSMENNTQEAHIIAITDKSEVIPCPIPFHLAKTPKLGDMLSKSFIKTINKREDCGEVVSVIEMSFGTGVIKHSNSLQEVEQIKNEYKKAVSEADLSSFPEAESYLMVNICNQKGIKMAMYGVLHITDKTGKPTGEGFAISPKPVFEDNINNKDIIENNNIFMNYFK